MKSVIKKQFYIDNGSHFKNICNILFNLTENLEDNVQLKV